MEVKDMKDYKWVLAKPDTRKRLKFYMVEHDCKSSDEALNKLLDEVTDGSGRASL